MAGGAGVNPSAVRAPSRRIRAWKWTTPRSRCSATSACWSVATSGSRVAGAERVLATCRPQGDGEAAPQVRRPPLPHHVRHVGYLLSVLVGSARRPKRRLVTEPRKQPGNDLREGVVDDVTRPRAHRPHPPKERCLDTGIAAAGTRQARKPSRTDVLPFLRRALSMATGLDGEPTPGSIPLVSCQVVQICCLLVADHRFTGERPDAVAQVSLLCSGAAQTRLAQATREERHPRRFAHLVWI